ncbi:tetratricopeptide repeat protein [Streptomyces nogalater]
MPVRPYPAHRRGQRRGRRTGPPLDVPLAAPDGGRGYRWYEPDHGAPPPTWQGTVDLSSADKAREWLQAEAPNWLAALHAAAADGDHATVVEVAESLHWFSDQWIFWGHWPEVFATAVRSAEALGDPLVEATQLNYYAWAVLLCEGRPRDSLEYSARALAAARRAGDLLQQAWAHQYAAWAHHLLGDTGPAFDDSSRAIALFDAAGDLTGMLQALLGRAWEQEAESGEAAIETYQQILARLDKVGVRLEPHIAAVTRANALAGLGRTYARMGRWDEGVRHLRTSVELCRTDGNIALESRYLRSLGDVLLDAGRVAEAREAFTRCIAVGPGADPEHVARARSRLARLDTP